MNIFYLHKDPSKAAAMHCDKHVVKMILETAQMMATAHRMSGDESFADSSGLPKKAHINHPSTQWVRESSEHYQWAYKLFTSLLSEYTQRYGKTHKYDSLKDAFSKSPIYVDNKGFKAPPKCMPDTYKKPSTVAAYRAYYIGEKAYFASWKRAKTPYWWTTASQCA